MLALAGDSASFAAGPDATDKEAVAPVRPVAVALTVAVPTVLGLKLLVATPELGATGAAGVKVPATPLTLKLMALVAPVLVLPKASWIVAL